MVSTGAINSISRKNLFERLLNPSVPSLTTSKPIQTTQPITTSNQNDIQVPITLGRRGFLKYLGVAGLSGTVFSHGCKKEATDGTYKTPKEQAEEAYRRKQTADYLRERGHKI